MYEPEETSPPLYTNSEDTSSPSSSSFTCAQNHRSSLQLQTSQGGTICLLCFCNLISNPSSLSLHISFALSQLSIAISQPHFLHNLITFHSHLLISSLTRLLCSTDDESVARQTIDLVSRLSDVEDPSVCVDFVSRIADLLVASGSLAWSRRQIYTLHCLGVLLNHHQKHDPSTNIKEKKALITNLISGLQLPSEEIRGEILFVLYKLSILEGGNDSNADFFLDSCPRLMHLSLDALVKTQSDEVRLNCVALLTVLAQRGFLKSSFVDDSSRDEDDFMQSTGFPESNTSMVVLFAEAIKGPLLSSDAQVQIGTLDLIFYCLSWERSDIKVIELLVEESITDYIFEILRLSGQKDPLVHSCLRVLDLLSVAEQPFNQRLTTGFQTLVPVLRYVAEVPFHPVQSHTLKLIGICISNFPGIISRSQVEEVVLVLTGMFRRNTTSSELTMLPETFVLCCSIFVSILKSPSSHGISTLTASVHEASKNALLSCLCGPQEHPKQLLLYSLYFLKEAHAYCYEEANLATQSIPSNDMIMDNFTMQLCETHMLPWLRSAINEMEEEENILGVLETCHSILLQGSDAQTKKFAEVLVSSSFFSLSFGCLGLFPTEKMKWRVFLMLSSIVDGVLGYDSGQPIRDAALYLPSDPLEMLFLLGQKSSLDMDLISCQSAILLILYCMSLYDERLAEGRQVLASLEQYILVNGVTFLGGGGESASLMQLVYLYSLFRGTAKRNYQTPYSIEAEKLLFRLVVEKDLDMLSTRIHPVSLKWLFQQEKISKPLSNQILNFCRLNHRHGIHMVLHGHNNQALEIETMAELVAQGDNLGATLLVSLLKQLQEEEGGEEDIISLVNAMILILNIIPATADQLCLCGIGRAIHSLFYYSCYYSSPQILRICSLLIFNILRSAQPQKLMEHDEVWLAISIKLVEVSIPEIDTHTCNPDALLVIGILCLYLHHSNNSALTEAAKVIVLNTSLVSAINNIVQATSSKGPSLVDHDEETSMGKTLIFVLLLYCFSLRSMHALLAGPLDWQFLFELSDRAATLPVIYVRCHELCRFLYFGSPPVKLVASHCLLELLTRITDYRNQELEAKCSAGYLKSVMAVLECLIFDCDAAVAINCGLCFSTILGWEKLAVQEPHAIKDNRWCRLVVEELTLYLTAPGLASRLFSNQHKAATHVATALLKQDPVPPWFKSVFDDSCISGIISNLSANDISEEMVQLFHMLLVSDYLKEEHITGLYHVFQARRKHIYAGDFEVDSTKENLEKVISVPDDLDKVYMVLFSLISSDSSPSMASATRGSYTKKQRLLDAIEMFLQESSNMRMQNL